MARRTWSGVVAIESQQTGDGRVFAEGSILWDDAALAANEVVFRWDREDDGAHSGAVEIGRVTRLERRDGGVIWGTGWVDDDWSDAADWIARAEAAGSMGVSIDADDYEVQVIDTTITEADLAEVDDDSAGVVMIAAAGDPDPGENGGVVLFEASAGEVLERWTRCRVRGLTSVDIPAFDQARVSLDTEAAETTDDDQEPAAVTTAAGSAGCGCGGACGGCGSGVVAAGAPAIPTSPPRAWFDYDPDLFRRYREQSDADEFGSVRVTDDGRVYGYLAAWGVCHTGYHGECVTTPRSSSNYGHFRTGYVVCDDGSEVTTGPISLGGGHADLRLSGAGAVEHYDSTSTAVADVAVGEDDFGVWFTGALRPGVTDEQIRTLRGSALSGDWRPVGSSLELVAALAVNAPGFPVPRARVASGRLQALVAAGAAGVARRARQRTAGPDPVSLDARVRVIEGQVAASARRRLDQHRRRVAVERLRG